MSDTSLHEFSQPAPLTDEEREANEKLKALLINDEGDISDKLEAALLRIFARFSSSYRAQHPNLDPLLPTTTTTHLPHPTAQDVLTSSDLDAFALATNGAPFPEEAKEEIQEYLDTDDDDNLTFRGFCEMFHLQSDNEPQETWKDLRKCGFNDELEFVGVEDKEGEQQEEKEKNEGEEGKADAKKEEQQEKDDARDEEEAVN
ncbi:hypothetical protein ACQY0O_000301 [Thecaphora frezii]